jgi:antitoxin component YwqK of YwqJK toxin-antitoxin module
MTAEAQFYARNPNVSDSFGIYTPDHIYKNFKDEIIESGVDIRRKCDSIICDGIVVDSIERTGGAITTNYMNGIKHGEYIYSSGETLTKGNYYKGQKVGLWETSISGKIEWSKEYKLDSTKLEIQLPENCPTKYCEGNIVTFYASGNIATICNYTDGRKNGEYKTLYENGIVRGIGNYSNGKRIGKWFWYRPNGKMLYEIDMSDQKLEKQETINYKQLIEYDEQEEILIKVSYFDFPHFNNFAKYSKGNKTEEIILLDSTKMEYLIKKYRDNGKLFYKEKSNKGHLEFTNEYGDRGKEWPDK